jgi:hypothetical protein
VVALQVVASQVNLRHGNAPVTFFNPIRFSYPRFLAPYCIAVTHSRYKGSQLSKSADRGYSTRTRKQGLNHLREAMYVDTDKVFDYLSRAGLGVNVSGLMKGKDLGVCFCYGTDPLLTLNFSHARSHIDWTASRNAPAASGL